MRASSHHCNGGMEWDMKWNKGMSCNTCMHRGWLTCPFAILLEVDPGDAPGSQEESIEPIGQWPQLAQHHLKYVQCTNTSCSSPVYAKKNACNYVPQTSQNLQVQVAGSSLSCVSSMTGCLEVTQSFEGWREISCSSSITWSSTAVQTARILWQHPYYWSSSYSLSAHSAANSNNDTPLPQSTSGIYRARAGP